MASTVLSSLHLGIKQEIEQAVIIQGSKAQWIKHDLDFIFLSH